MVNTFSRRPLWRPFPSLPINLITTLPLSSVAGLNQIKLSIGYLIWGYWLSNTHLSIYLFESLRTKPSSTQYVKIRWSSFTWVFNFQVIRHFPSFGNWIMYMKPALWVWILGCTCTNIASKCVFHYCNISPENFNTEDMKWKS